MVFFVTGRGYYSGGPPIRSFHSHVSKIFSRYVSQSPATEQGRFMLVTPDVYYPVQMLGTDSVISFILNE